MLKTNMNRFKENLSLIALCIPLSVMTGCEGDSEDFPLSDSEQPSQGGESTGSTGFNGGLTGRLLTTAGQNPIQYDLSSGEFSDFPAVTVQQVLAANDLPTIIHSNGFFETGGAEVGGAVRTHDQGL